MRTIGWFLVAVLLTLSFSASVGTVAAEDVGDPAVVYVAPNGSCYHRADCPRLRFGKAMPIAEAARTHRPCAVCMVEGTPATSPQPVAAVGKPSGSASVAAKEEEEAAAASTPAKTVPPSSGHGRKFHALVGAAIGYAAGIAIAYAAYGAHDDPDGTWKEAAGFVGLLGGGAGAAVGALLPVRSEPAAGRAGDAAPLRRMELPAEQIAACFRFRSAGPR